jgi:hypothetical protein
MTKRSEYNKKWRDANPMKYCYITLRDNSKRRGKVFTISFEYFKRFCYRTKYIQNKGRHRENYSIDRINNELGYIPGNIKCVTVALNSAKGTKVVSFDYYRESKFKVI